jgi:hypothetical protein
MTVPRRMMPVITLGWQSWSLVVIVLTVALLAAFYVLTA